MRYDEILTGEGVLLEARPASFAVRVVSGLIDALIYVTVLGTALSVLSAAVVAAGEQFGAAIAIFSVAVVTVIAPTTIETLSRGRSVGKLAMGVRIVRDDGGPVRFRHAFIRALVGLGELWLTLGSVAVITSMVNSRGKRVGDVLAGTYAVRVSGGATTSAAIIMPPQLQAWAGSADIRRLPDGLALAARQFLGRAARLHPQSRARMGTELAAHVGQFVAPAPPPGTHPETFLAAVLAERRNREYAMYTRLAATRDAEAVVMRRLPHAVPDPAD